MHPDLGPYNISMSSQIYSEIRATIDWEFVASALYASLHRNIEILFLGLVRSTIELMNSAKLSGGLSLTISCRIRARRHWRSYSGSGSAYS
ncbi:hypothetical protein V8F33_004275 [Rhypophila sp. PSN 637]